MPPKPTPAAVSFSQLAYERYSRALRNYLMNRVRNHEDARELAQEVWTRLMRVTDPQRVLDPKSYIYRVAAHVVAEFQALRRQDVVQFDSEVLTNVLESAPPNEDSTQRLDAQRDVMSALAPLTATFREIIVLRVREGMSYQEIGARLGFSAGTAERYFFSAMAEARAAWITRDK